MVPLALLSFVTESVQGLLTFLRGHYPRGLTHQFIDVFTGGLPYSMPDTLMKFAQHAQFRIRLEW